MADTLQVPVLLSASDALHTLSGEEAISRLLLTISKCQKFISEGRRIENISWRVWFRDYHAKVSVPDSQRSDMSLNAILLDNSHPQSSFTTRPLLSPSSPRSNPLTSGSKPLPTSNRNGPMPQSGRTITTILADKLSLVPSKKIVRRKADNFTTNNINHCDSIHSVPLLLTPTASSTPRDGAALAPRLVIVNPTPHPTPPTTPHNRQAPTSVNGRVFASGFLTPLDMPPVMQLTDIEIPSTVSTITSSSSGSSKTSSSTQSSEQPVSGKLFFVSNAPGSASPEKALPLTPEPTLPLDSPSKESTTGSSEAETSKNGNRQDGSSVTSSGSILTQAQKGKSGAHGRHTRARTAKFAIGTASSKSSTSGPRLRAHELAQSKKSAANTPVSVGTNLHISQQSPPGVDASGSKQKRTNGNKHQRKMSAQISKRASPETRAVLQRVQTQPLPHAHRPLRNYNNVIKLQAHHLAQPLVPKTNVKRKVEIVSSSSEFETEDGSEWSSVLEEEPDVDATAKQHEPETSKAKPSGQLSQAAAEAARQLNMFKKRPPSEYINAANRNQTGLLSNLFRPDPNLFPEGHPYRTSLSHHDLVARAGVPGRGPTLYYSAMNNANSSNRDTPAQVQKPARVSPPSASVRLWSSRSAVALPELANVTVGSITSNGVSNNVVSPTKSAKTTESSTTRSTLRSNGFKEAYRPRGRPADVELSDSDDDDDPDNSVQVESSVVQKRLAEIAQQRSRPQQKQIERRTPQSLNGTTDNTPQVRPPNPGPLTLPRTRPVAIGYPYNLPAPTPPLSPGAHRRKMYWEECGFSLLKHMTHEHAEGYGLVHEGVRFVRDRRTREVQAEERRNRLQRNKSWAADDFHMRGW